MYAEQDAAGLAQMLGMEESMIRQIFRLDARELDLDNSTMPLQEFVSFLQTLMNDPAYSSSFDGSLREKLALMQQIMQLASSGRALSAAELSAVLGMDAGFITQLFMGYSAQIGTEITAMPLNGFVDFLVNGILPNPEYAAYFDDVTKAQLNTMQQLSGAAASAGKGSGIEV